MIRGIKSKTLKTKPVGSSSLAGKRCWRDGVQLAGTMGVTRGGTEDKEGGRGPGRRPLELPACRKTGLDPENEGLGRGQNKQFHVRFAL